ncbi:vacuolar sorting ATPase Vps4 [Pyrenophora tritici-repentis]|nr:vacuolar sorting ATPase Vps4 [Pyrenophora tritici-repentis]
MSNADFLGRAIETVKKAIETDTAGEYEKAYQLYYSALELFMLALKCGNATSHLDLAY